MFANFKGSPKKGSPEKQGSPEKPASQDLASLSHDPAPPSFLEKAPLLGRRQPLKGEEHFKRITLEDIADFSATMATRYDSQSHQNSGNKAASELANEWRSLTC